MVCVQVLGPFSAAYLQRAHRLHARSQKSWVSLAQGVFRGARIYPLARIQAPWPAAAHP